MPFVPLDRQEEAWQIITTTIPNAQFKPILDYFNDTYFDQNKARYQRRIWNHFKTDINRTNNSLESFNAKINKELQTAHPNLWKFIDFCKSLDNSMVLNIASQANKIQSAKSFVKKKIIKQHQAESDLQSQLSSNNIDLTDYLLKYASLFIPKTFLFNDDDIDMQQNHASSSNHDEQQDQARSSNHDEQQKPNSDSEQEINQRALLKIKSKIIKKTQKIPLVQSKNSKISKSYKKPPKTKEVD